MADDAQIGGLIAATPGGEECDDGCGNDQQDDDQCSTHEPSLSCGAKVAPARRAPVSDGGEDALLERWLAHFWSTAFTIHESIAAAGGFRCAIRDRERPAPRVILGILRFPEPRGRGFWPSALTKAIFGGRI
jgi:hypothetical protein